MMIVVWGGFLSRNGNAWLEFSWRDRSTSLKNGRSKRTFRIFSMAFGGSTWSIVKHRHLNKFPIGTLKLSMCIDINDIKISQHRNPSGPNSRTSLSSRRTNTDERIRRRSLIDFISLDSMLYFLFWCTTDACIPYMLTSSTFNSPWIFKVSLLFLSTDLHTTT